MCRKDLEEFRIQKGFNLGQTRLLSYTEGLVKNEWHEFLVDMISTVDCLSARSTQELRNGRK